MTIEEYVVAIDEVASKQLKKCYFFEWLAFHQRQFSRARKLFTGYSRRG
jgi:hypothetical protein